MQLTARHRFAIAWLLLGALAAAVCSLIWPAAHVGNELIPVGNDSFYHARRILDTAANPGAFYEFDPRIHAPEGSLLVWPWGYDYAMAWLVRIGVGLGLAQRPIAVLIWLPVAAVFVSVGLIMLIARRMGLSLWFAALAAVGVALSPLTQYLHGVGFVDHHFAEYMLVLATVWAGLRWLEDQQPRSAVLLGLVLGLAPAVHNALFILQIPVLVCLFIRWRLELRMPAAATAYFCAALLTACVAILIPSQPFREGRFEYYYLSWFHLYVTGGTALCCVFFSRVEPHAKSLAALVGGGILLLLPLAYQMSAAQAFLSGEITRLESIGEMQSPLAMLRETSFGRMSARYSLFLWLLPATYTYCAWKIWQDRRSHRLCYWVCAVLGLSLLLLQFRLHYFGTFALCIPLLVVLQQLATRWHLSGKYLPLAATAIVLAMFAPPLRDQLLGPMLPANDPSFTNVRESLRVLAKACQSDRGVVLADNDAGHYIRYYTECSVVADNFLLTRQHEEKIHEMEQLFALDANALRAAAPFVKYVMVRPAYIQMTEQGVSYRSYSGGLDNLIADLLLRPHGAHPVAPPAEFELLYSANLASSEDAETPYLALYKIQHDINALARGAGP